MKNKKLNIIDYLILAVLVLALGLVGYKVIKGRSSAKMEDTGLTLSPATLRFTVVCQVEDRELVTGAEQELNGPDYDINGSQVSARRIFNSNKLLDGAIVSWETETDEDATQMRFVVEAAPTVASGVYTLGWQELRLGKEYNLKTLGLELTGTIVALEKLG